MWKYIFAIIMLLFYCSVWGQHAHEEYLDGFWAAEDDDFCKSSEISSMMILIGKPTHGWLSSTRKCHIVIADDLCNQGFTICYNGGWAPIGTHSYKITASVEFDEEAIWNDTVNITTNMLTGTMKIYYGDTIYAKLSKNHEISNITGKMADAEIISDAQ